jgi:hypothetical protein
MRVAILQSNYLPWKGYFDIIGMVDTFIFLDDVQFTKNDWRNRNKIKTEKGLEWLSVPCGKNIRRLICEVEINDPGWQQQHWRKIEAAYKKANHFADYKDFFEDLFLGRVWNRLSEMNQHMVAAICTDILGITTRMRDSREFATSDDKTRRLVEMVQAVGGSEYLSGPAARDYLDVAAFEREGIRVSWMDYSGYPEYRQLHPPFEHGVSILDLIFNEGPRAREFLKSTRTGG